MQKRYKTKSIKNTLHNAKKIQNKSMPKMAYTREDGAKDIPLDAKIKKPKNFKQQTFYNKKIH